MKSLILAAVLLFSVVSQAATFRCDTVGVVPHVVVYGGTNIGNHPNISDIHVIIDDGDATRFLINRRLVDVNQLHQVEGQWRFQVQAFAENNRAMILNVQAINFQGKISISLGEYLVSNADAQCVYQ